MSAEYHDDDEITQRSYDPVILRRLMGYIRPHRTAIIAATALLFVAALMSNAVPLLTMLAFDAAIGAPERIAIEQAVAANGGEATPEQSQALAAIRAENLASLPFFIGLMAALMLGEALVRYAQLYIVAVVGQQTMLDMRMGIFRHLQNMSLRFLDRNPVGRLMSRVTNDVEKIQATIVTGMVQVISDLFMIVVVLAFMFAINVPLSLLAISTIPLVFLASLLFRKYAHASYLEIMKRIAKVNVFMQENVTGMHIVQLFGRQARNHEAFAKLNAAHRDEWLRQIRYYAVYFPVVDFLGDLTLAIIILYGGTQILGGFETIAGTASVGMFFAYVQYTERLFGPVRAIADRYNLLLEAMASSERIFKLLDTPPDVEDKLEALPADAIEGAIDFDGVWFAYNEENWVLKGVDLAIRPGERIAVVGHTGAGKTTLSAILSRFYDVQKGAVRIDGVDVRDYQQTPLRGRIGVVLQDVFLFSGSVADNIRLGDASMTDEWVRACAEYVNAAPFIERLPGGYAYDVGERGCHLSTGQRQLLAFARTLAHNPRILVLDEATSSVDTATEAYIQDAIHKLMEGRTSVVIAHRLSTIQNADRIVVMHHGEIREIGNHQELLAQRGIYYTLYRLQYKDQADVA